VKRLTSIQIVFVRTIDILQLNLNSGELLYHTTEDRSGGRVTWSHDGKYLTFAAERSSGDQDIFIADVVNSLRDSKGQKRVARFVGIDNLPVFRLDDRVIAFAHRKLIQSSNKGPWAVYTVEPNKVDTKNTSPRLVADGFASIQRLSWFPDNRHLLVCTGEERNNLKVVDVETGHISDLVLAPMLDPGLGHAPILRVADVVLDRTGTKLAFSGYSNTGENGSPGWFIYNCNLNGTDLKRVTPSYDVRPSLYRFPQTGTTQATKVGWASGESMLPKNLSEFLNKTRPN
jgi:Tol biopolymer transport system component